MELSSPPVWSRVFNPPLPPHILGVSAAIFLVADVVCLALRSGQERGLLDVFVGLLLLAGSLFLLCLWALGTRHRVSIGSEVFRTETFSRCGVSGVKTYRWSDVVATRYKVATFVGEDQDAYTKDYSVVTRDGVGFSFGADFKPIAELIDLCNDLAPQVPYIWLPRQKGQEWEHAGEPSDDVVDGKRRVHEEAEFVCAPRAAAS